MSMLKNPILFFLSMMFVVLSHVAVANPLLDWESGDTSEASSQPKNETIVDPLQNAVIPNPVNLGGAPNLATQDRAYRVGPLDVIEVEVFLVEELNHEARIDANGNISLPLIGTLYVSGFSVQKIEDLIEDKLREQYLRDPHVTVIVKDYKSQTITMEGWVSSPGVYPLISKTTFLQAIANAGGMDKMADHSEVAIFRKIEGKGTIGYIIDYTQIRAGSLVDPVLKSGDIIVVNRSGTKAAWAAAKDVLGAFIGWSVLF